MWSPEAVDVESGVVQPRRSVSTPKAAAEAATPTHDVKEVVVPKEPEVKHADGGDELSRSVSGSNEIEWNVDNYQVGRGKKSKTIIRNIVGKAKSGQLVALLGPSGSGKTTLLQCISLRCRDWKGAIKYNRKVPEGDFFTTSALVHQKEVIFGFLTPREHLLFHARARMSATFRYSDICKRVEEVIKEARLEKCVDTMIGGNDLIFNRKGLSGGERKRLALATELLHCPEIIFLDEPSSGLDSVMAETIVSLLAEMAKRGRIVVTCVHCPSSDLMRHFTDLVLLTYDGRMAFHGPKAKAVPHFEALGYEYPLDYNPADYLLKVVSCHPEAEKAEEVSRVDGIVKTFKQSEWYIKRPLRPTDAHKAARRVKGLGASDWDLLVINCWRTALQMQRDTISVTLWGAVNVLMGTLFGVLFYNQAGNNWRNLMGLTYALATSALMLGSMSMVVRFPLDWAPVVREYFSGSNAVGPYVLSRLTIVPALIYGPIAMATILYWMCGMNPDFKEFVLFVFVFTSVELAAVALGQFASCISANILVGLAALPAMSTPMILFSGLLYQRGTVPAWLSWIESVSIVNYGFSAMLIQQVPILRDRSGDMVLKFIGIDPSSFWYDIGMLWLLFLAFNVGTYIALVIRMRSTNDVVS